MEQEAQNDHTITHLREVRVELGVVAAQPRKGLAHFCHALLLLAQVAVPGRGKHGREQ